MSRHHQRLVGIDVARAVAILGMIITNFRGKFQPASGSLSEVAWWLDRTEGKWAALFVVLAGMGLGVQASRASSALDRARLRRATLTRASVLFVLGLLHLHWWRWDILTFYGVYMVASIGFLWARTWMLWAGMVTLALASGWQWMNLLRPKLDFWTPWGAAKKLLFWGNYPLVPWFALVLFGIWLARQDLRNPRTRGALAAAAAVVLLVSELINAHVRDGGPGLADPPLLDMLRTWPRPTRPGFAIAGPAFATLVVVAAVHLSLRRDKAWYILALAAGGQLALTLYVAHVPAMLVPLARHCAPTHLAPLLLYAGVFYVVCLAAALWWRRRFERGPLEGLLTAVIRPPRPCAPNQLLGPSPEPSGSVLSTHPSAAEPKVDRLENLG